MVVPLVLLWALSAVAQDGGRVTIDGRDMKRDGKPYVMHGILHADPGDPNLVKIGMNAIHGGVSFRSSFDPRKSDAQNAAAFQGHLKIADEAHKNGMMVLWLPSMHYVPGWLWERHPDARMKKHDGSDGSAGWHTICMDHPGYRDDAAKWLTLLAKTLGPHPATLGYVLANEPHLVGDVCYSPHTIAAFHKWLEERYETIEALNKTWGTKVASFADVKAPAPRGGVYWYKMYDKMVSDPGKAPGAPAAADNPALWMDWMRFRQENFAAFFKWEAEVIRAADPNALITSKIVPFDMYTSHAYGAGTNTELWTHSFLDVVGMDLYSHLDESFLARWKSDYFYSLSQGKPIWHTEFNFTFAKQRGLATPEQWRTTFYYQLAHGVTGFLNYHWADNDHLALRYTGNRFAPVTHEIAIISEQLKTLAPMLAGMTRAPAQVAVLHSTTTGLALSGDYAATADQTTIIDLLYRSHTPFEFVTEDMVRSGVLKKYRVLVAVGAVALPDDVLDAIEKFTDENGGHVIANARFGELDEYARVRADYPPAWLGVKVAALHRRPREKTGTLELRRQGRTRQDKPIDVHVKMDTWSSRPITLEPGKVTASGNIYGDEDTQQQWSSSGRHELCWEDVAMVGDGKVAGTFEDGAPAIVETAQTVYIARDICWVDENFEHFFRRFLRKSGVLNRNAAMLKSTGGPAASVDLRMWEGQGRRLLFVINSAPTLDYAGEPAEVELTFDAYGNVAGALTGEAVESRWRDFKRIIPMRLEAGEVRVLLGKPYPAGWRSEKAKYEELREHYQPDSKPYVAWRRSPRQLWVYDGRTEVGMGSHGFSNDHIRLIKKLGVRIVRRSIYWWMADRTLNADGSIDYDTTRLKGIDDQVERAKANGIDLDLIIVHPNGWKNRHEIHRQYAHFAGFLAQRYPSVRYWELGNEVDAGWTDLFGAYRPGYHPFERGRCYAQMLKLAYPAIKKANPRAWVLFEGMGNPDPDFIRGVYEEGAGDCFDFMNTHTYGMPLQWPMLVRGYAAKMALARYGDFNRPMWNTEFGLSAKQSFAAWQVSTGKGFDDGQLSAWKSSITEGKLDRIFWKILPYTFVGGPTSKLGKEVTIPEGHTTEDYGYGIVRRDGVTPRPTYDWMLEAQVNQDIQDRPTFQTDVQLMWDGSWQPQGYEYETADGVMTIKAVKIDSIEPTVIKLQTLQSGLAR